MLNPAPRTVPDAAGLPPRLVAWMDGAGAFLLCMGERTTFGGAAGDADVRLSADLLDVHATLARSGEGHLVEAAGALLVAPRKPGSAAGGVGAGRLVAGRTDLNNGDELILFRDGLHDGDAGVPGVRLRFSRPNALTATATLTVLGDRRTTPRYDGVILLAEACVFGPNADAHVRCRDAEESVLLFRRDGGLWVRSNGPVELNGKPIAGPAPVTAGDHVTAPGVSFRLAAE